MNRSFVFDINQRNQKRRTHVALNAITRMLMIVVVVCVSLAGLVSAKDGAFNEDKKDFGQPETSAMVNPSKLL